MANPSNLGFHKNKNYKLKVVIEEYLSEKPKC